MSMHPKASKNRKFLSLKNLHEVFNAKLGTLLKATKKCKNEENSFHEASIDGVQYTSNPLKEWSFIDRVSLTKSVDERSDSILKATLML